MKSTKVFEVHWMEPGETFKKNTHIWGAMAKRKIIWNPGKTVFAGGNLPQNQPTLWREKHLDACSNLKKNPQSEGHVASPVTPDLRSLWNNYRRPGIYRDLSIRNLRVAGSSLGAKTSPGNTYKRLALLVDFHRILNFQTYYSPTRL